MSANGMFCLDGQVAAVIGGGGVLAGAMATGLAEAGADIAILDLSLEGAEPLGQNLNLLDVFYRLGLRMVSLTHSRRNAWADGTQLEVQTGGLTYSGRELIRRMNELGIVIDLAHLSDAGVWEVLARSQAPVIYSHTAVAAMPDRTSRRRTMGRCRQHTRVVMAVLHAVSTFTLPTAGRRPRQGPRSGPCPHRTAGPPPASSPPPRRTTASCRAGSGAG